MSRYWCKVCQTELNTEVEYDFYSCPSCQENGNYSILLEAIPEWETPKQYEARTGKKLSDDAAVWYMCNTKTTWELFYYVEAMDRAGKIVVANSPHPPPEDWEEACGGDNIDPLEYETPEQWEDRTGKKLSDDAAVWLKIVDDPQEVHSEWTLVTYIDALMYERASEEADYAPVVHILVCQSPEPPPDDFKESV